ncbi:MAG: leucine-rich repeat domain-containing protein [Holosporaceae bacterium]|nr:leucine-rich repeat domain-containing protein [Holosporaceae bacterium]
MIVIPDSVISLGDYCFNLCFGLETVTFGNRSHLISIGKYVFADCISFWYLCLIK